MTLSNRAPPAHPLHYAALQQKLGRRQIDPSNYAGIVGRKTFPNIALPY